MTLEEDVMKNKYKNPKIEIAKFSTENIVTVSGNPDKLNIEMRNKGYSVTTKSIKNFTW